MDLEKGKQDEFHLHHLGKQNNPTWTLPIVIQRKNKRVSNIFK